MKKVVSYLVLWVMDWWQSHLGLGAHLRRWQRKQNVKRRMWIFLHPNWDESSHLVFRGQNPLKLLYSIMILNTIPLAYKARPIKWKGNKCTLKIETKGGFWVVVDCKHKYNPNWDNGTILHTQGVVTLYYRKQSP